MPNKVVDEGGGKFRIEFTTIEVGSYLVDVNAKVNASSYNASLSPKFMHGFTRITKVQS